MLLERNDALVCEAFRRGEFDYLDAAGEISETEFFRAIASKKILEKLASSYPTPLKKHDVPLWVYIVSNLSMRFHGVNAFHAFPYVVRSGGMIQAFGPQMGHRAIHPQSGDVTLSCRGFNHKNDYDRQTPCDADYLRKMARRTPADRLQNWFNRDVVAIFRQHHAFDREGIFIGDATYLFVPDNDRYEGSVRLLFDEHNHPVESVKLTPQQRSRYRWRRCYKLITLIHTNRAGEFFLYTGVKITSGQDHECPLLYQLVEQFVAWQGRGIIKRLILDRGFLDGPSLGRCKQQWGIDVLIPARRNMDIYQDVVGLAQAGALSFQTWNAAPAPAQALSLHRPASVRKREEARQKKLAERPAAAPASDPCKTLLRSETAGVPGLRTFSSCPVPIHAVLNRDVYADGHTNSWLLLDTAENFSAAAVRSDYALRTTVEEGYRQLKCFQALADFSSRAFSLIVNQVIFVLLTHSLLQWYLFRNRRQHLNRKTRPRLLDVLRPTLHVILIYYQNYVAFLSPLQHQEMVLTLSEPARRKILAKTRKLRRALAHQLENPRAP
jgi:Transposase DDE domain